MTARRAITIARKHVETTSDNIHIIIMTLTITTLMIRRSRSAGIRIRTTINNNKNKKKQEEDEKAAKFYLSFTCRNHMVQGQNTDHKGLLRPTGARQAGRGAFREWGVGPILEGPSTQPEGIYNNPTHPVFDCVGS